MIQLTVLRPYYDTKARHVQETTPPISKFDLFPSWRCAGTKPSEGAGQKQRAAAPTNNTMTGRPADTLQCSMAELQWGCTGSLNAFPLGMFSVE